MSSSKKARRLGDEEVNVDIVVFAFVVLVLFVLIVRIFLVVIVTLVVLVAIDKVHW